MRRPTLALCIVLASHLALSQETAKPFSDIGHITCAESTERYLPADYYFCAGNKALQGGNTRKALSMYEIAASWGDKRSMFNLGLLLYRGNHVPKNEALGMAWLALAAERKDDTLQRETLAAVWSAAKPETREAANALWNRMKLKYADRVAQARGLQRYERETRELRRTLFFDPFAQVSSEDFQLSGNQYIKMLDEAAEEVIDRPSPHPKGKVKVGTMERASESQQAKP